MTVSLFELSEHVRNDVVDGVFHFIANISKIHLLDCGEYLLHGGLFESFHFAKRRTSLLFMIFMFEFEWAFVPSKIMSGPG